MIFYCISQLIAGASIYFVVQLNHKLYSDINYSLAKLEVEVGVKASEIVILCLKNYNKVYLDLMKELQSVT